MLGRPRPLEPSARAGLLFLALAALSHGSGCERGADPLGRPRTVRAQLTQAPASLSLIGKTDYNAEKVACQLTDSLVQYDPAMNLVPRVAESWEFSPDGRTLTFRLRDGVRWHDGRTVVADDVVFTVEQVRDPAVESPTWAALFSDLTALEAPDGRTVLARYRVATPDVLEGWRVPLIPRHLAESGAQLLTGAFNQRPVGCGPFRFVRQVEGEEIVLEANDDYWDGRPLIDRLVLRIFPDERTAFQALFTGDLDVMVGTPALLRQARESARANSLESFVYSRTSVWLLRFNQDGTNPFFVDARVRRALILALDRQQFVDEMLDGLGRVAATTYHPDLPWTDRAVEPLPYDPMSAGRLLDEAGWRRPAPAALRERGGRPFRFTLLFVASTQPIAEQTAAWLQQSWAEIGIAVEIEKLEWNHYRDRRNGGQFQAAMDGLSSTGIPDQYELYHSGMRREGVNYMAFADPLVDRLLEEGRTTFDPALRRPIYFRLQRRLLELQPVGCLFHFATPVLHDRRLRGIEPSPLDFWRTTRGPRVWSWAAGD